MSSLENNKLLHIIPDGTKVIIECKCDGFLNNYKYFTKGQRYTIYDIDKGISTVDSNFGMVCLMKVFYVNIS